MARAEGSTVITEQGMDPLKEECVFMHIKAGEELVHRAEHIAPGGGFPVLGEFVTSAFLLSNFGQKVCF